MNTQCDGLNILNPDFQIILKYEFLTRSDDGDTALSYDRGLFEC